MFAHKLFMNSAEYSHFSFSPFIMPLLQFFPPEDWLMASSVPSKFSPDAIQKVLNELTPDNVR